jgi:L-arabinose isomerase
MIGKITSGKLWSDKNLKEKIAEWMNVAQSLYISKEMTGENYLKLKEIFDEAIRNEQKNK